MWIDTDGGRHGRGGNSREGREYLFGGETDRIEIG